MKRLDIEDENKKLLLSRYKLLNEGAHCMSIGLSLDQSVALHNLDIEQVSRAASVQVPLFVFDCSAEILAQAFKYSSAPSDTPVEMTFLFLLNRWRACENSLTAIQTFYRIDKKIYYLMRNATGSEIINAASSGMILFRLSVHARYLTHAGSRFDLRDCQRNKYAICAAL